MKKTTIRIETSPRELTIEKKVCDIIAEYTEIETLVEFEIVESSGENKKFSLKDFLEENDNLTRREFISPVSSLEVYDYILNTGIIETYTDKNGIVKERQQKLNTKTKVIIYIK